MSIFKIHRQWTFDLPTYAVAGPGEEDVPVMGKRTHTVELEHSYWTMRRVIKLDGVLVPRSLIRSYSILYDRSYDQFGVGGHKCMVRVLGRIVTYEYDCAIDGTSITTGQPMEMGYELSGIRQGASDRIPKWAWLFMVSCFVAGILAVLGGALLGVAIVQARTPNREILKFGNVFFISAIIYGVFAIARESKDQYSDSSFQVRQCALLLARVVGFNFVVALIITILFH